ncbi:MAG: GAF domain-containing protein, partial [Candidatus Hodarchaeales archaeon]
MKYKTKKKYQPIHEITDNHQAHMELEKYQNLTPQLLNLVNKTDNKTDFIKEILYFIKVVTGDQAGELIRDPEGNPYLECMCGNILSGKTNPSLPFFTAGGSFWTNSTTELLASTTREDRQGRTRNRCNSEGYESMALIPLRYDKKIIGLLQLNDSRKDIFTSNLIRFFEGVGSSIGIALEFKETYDT